MKDQFGRKIDYLRLSITDRCNLRCRYCMPEQGVDSVGHGRVLSYEELERVAAAAVRLGVRKIRVTGGEPLVRRGVVDFIAALAKLPGEPDIVLTTNGLLLAEMSAALADAGLARVNISIDTLRDERFDSLTRRHGLAEVRAGIAAAEEAGLTPVKLNMVPIRDVNDDEIADFARLTLAHSWDVRFIEFMPVRGDLGFSPEQRVDEADILAAVEAVGPLQAVPVEAGSGPARMYRLDGGLGRIGVITAVSRHFCDSCNRLRLTPDGRLRPCLMADDEIDLRQLLREEKIDDAALEALLAEAIGAKPERHSLEAGAAPMKVRTMKDIGG